MGIDEWAISASFYELKSIPGIATPIAETPSEGPSRRLQMPNPIHELICLGMWPTGHASHQLEQLLTVQ